MFSPLKITAYLRCAAVTDEALPIDAILYYYAMREEYGAQDITVPGGHVRKEAACASVPLLMLNKGPQWYYAASFAQWSEPVTEMIDYWNKRFDQKYSDMVDFGGKRGKIIVEKGRYRAYHMPIFTRHAISVTWYVMGGIERIESLLKFATHIGKKTSQGWGEVIRWEVEPIGNDYSVYGPQGELMRAIPVKPIHEHETQFKLLYCGYRPSYWDSRNQAMCLFPTGIFGKNE